MGSRSLTCCQLVLPSLSVSDSAAANNERHGTVYGYSQYGNVPFQNHLLILFRLFLMLGYHILVEAHSTDFQASGKLQLAQRTIYETRQQTWALQGHHRHFHQHVVIPLKTHWRHSEDTTHGCDPAHMCTTHQVGNVSVYRAGKIGKIIKYQTFRNWGLTCSPNAHPPHQRIRANVQRSPTGANMNRYWAPPRRKQWVVNSFAP